MLCGPRFLGSVPAWASQLMNENCVASKMEPARSSILREPSQRPEAKERPEAGREFGTEPSLSPTLPHPADGHQPLSPHPQAVTPFAQLKVTAILSSRDPMGRRPLPSDSVCPQQGARRAGVSPSTGTTVRSSWRHWRSHSYACWAEGRQAAVHMGQHNNSHTHCTSGGHPYSNTCGRESTGPLWQP